MNKEANLQERKVCRSLLRWHNLYRMRQNVNRSQLRRSLHTRTNEIVHLTNVNYNPNELESIAELSQKLLAFLSRKLQPCARLILPLNRLLGMKREQDDLIKILFSCEVVRPTLTFLLVIRIFKLRISKSAFDLFFL